MANFPVPQRKRKRAWELSQSAFRQFLHWLDSGTDSDGQRYLEIRRRLVFYFDRKNCLSSDELADETLNRVARRLEEEGTIATDTPAHYCYIVARFVFLESLRDDRRKETLDDNLTAMPESGEEKREVIRREECLEQCVEKLESADRLLIVGYYQGQQRSKIDNRRTMAAKLGITVNALSIRACRIREKIEACMRKCLDAK